MTNKEMMNIRYETCDLWNSLKDKSKIIDTVIDLKEQNLELKSELEELKKNAVIPEFKKGKWVYVIENNKIYNVKLNKPCIEIIYDYAYNCKKQIDEDGFEDVDYDIGISDGSNLYSTKQQAEEALKKLEEV